MVSYWLFKFRYAVSGGMQFGMTLCISSLIMASSSIYNNFNQNNLENKPLYRYATMQILYQTNRKWPWRSCCDTMQCNRSFAVVHCIQAHTMHNIHTSHIILTLHSIAYSYESPYIISLLQLAGFFLKEIYRVLFVSKLYITMQCSNTYIYKCRYHKAEITRKHFKFNCMYKGNRCPDMSKKWLNTHLNVFHGFLIYLHLISLEIYCRPGKHTCIQTTITFSSSKQPHQSKIKVSRLQLLKATKSEGIPLSAYEFQYHSQHMSFNTYLPG